MAASLMGILNITDNSFVRGSRMAGKSVDEIVRKAAQMLDEGASLIDVGACSTAPGNVPVSEALEWERLRLPLEALFSTFPSVRFSLDSFRTGVVRKALDLDHEFIINDISAGQDDPSMLPLVAASGMEYIAMDRSADPYSFFEKFHLEAESKGIRRWYLDPGFGFGKSVERCREILNSLERFRDFGRPVLVALSRKRMIWQPLGLSAESCARQSIEAENLAISKGAAIVRTHDLRRL